MTWRIRDRETFETLRRRGRRARAGVVAVTWLPAAAPDGRASTAEPPRVAYAVSRQVGNAVTRNRLRRRLRALVQQRSSRLEPGAYLLTAVPEAVDATHSTLQRDLDQALAKAGALRHSPGGAPTPPSRRACGPLAHAGAVEGVRR